MLAYFVASMSPTMEIASAALPTYVVSLLFYAGFLLRWKNIPNYWKWCALFSHVFDSSGGMYFRKGRKGTLRRVDVEKPRQVVMTLNPKP